MNNNNNNKKYYVGIRREDKSVWERRVALMPQHLKQVLYEHPEICFIVQPSPYRICQDSEYQAAGAIVQEDLSQCSLILGVKEVPVECLEEGKTYMHFAHVIKAQPAGMPALDTMLKRNVRMIDYEKICDDNNQRLIAFGRFAGIAGTIDYLHGMGKFLLEKGWATAFLRIAPSYVYKNLEHAYSHLKGIKEEFSDPSK